MNGGAKDPLVDQPHVFLKGENMKKRTHLFFVVLTLLPFAATPVQTHAQETYTIKAEQHATTEVVPELPSISRIPVTTQEPDPHNAALVSFTDGFSFSSFLSPFSAVGATLSSALVSLPASAAVVSAILGAGLGYSFYQLGSSLGVATADLLKTNASLYELSSNNPALQQELAAFATSGIDSTTSTYNFSQGLQKRYAQDVTSHALMREYLTGTTDHGAYRFSINDHPAFRKLISYGSLFTESARTGVIGRDASVADRMFIEDQFFLLEMVRVMETRVGSDTTLLTISGHNYGHRGSNGSFVHEVELSVPMSVLMSQIATQEDFLEYIQQNTTFEFGVIETPSREVAVQTAQQMAQAYHTRTADIQENLAEVLAPTENGLSFDPSGIIATLYGQTVVLDATGKFVYADTRVAVPEYQWGAIDFAYSEAAIPIDDSITIDGRRGVFDPDTGNIVDQFGHILVFAPLGVWTRELYNTLVEQLKQYEENEDRWYTPLDLIYDERFADGGKGHTLELHSGQSWSDLERRLDANSYISNHASFYNALQALVMINYGIWSAKNQGLLTGSSKLNFGHCHLQPNNQKRIRYESYGYLSFGLSLGRGVERIRVA
ncbi:hypothetical protein UA3_00402 [Enterococcus faecium EnGen0263]|uniref:hypothetical protein n=1 Tax=Enterococcus faecium TaxID=1352 RepID=UPI00033087E7|nr:hypothetical protein [Enterococcus faecium]EOH57737.1 hypothetical protein UA3_00402 [Enterococcus faecium EnGen0263]